MTASDQPGSGSRGAASPLGAGHLCLAVTPFSADGSLDLESLRSLLDHLVAGGVDGIVVLGSTGEFFSLLPEERARVVELAADHCRGRVPVIAGIGSSSTYEAVQMAHHAAASGVAAVMVPPPFYAPGFFNTAAGMREHLAAVAAASGDAEVMLYDGGGGIEIPIEVTEQLAKEHDNVTMVKLTVPAPPKIAAIQAATGGRLRVLCGNDALTLYELALGVDGVCIGVGNVVPNAVSETAHSYLAGNVEQARSRFYDSVLPVASVALAWTPKFVALFKYALARMGVIAADSVRLPLTPLDDKHRQEAEAALRRVGVL